MHDDTVLVDQERTAQGNASTFEFNVVSAADVVLDVGNQRVANLADTAVLDRYPLPGPRYAYGSDNPEAIAYAIDPNWAGELPRSYLFNGKGGKEKISGVINAAILEKGLAAK